MYKLKSLTSGEMALYKDDLQLVILPDRSHISIEFIIDQKHYQKTYKVLETFLQEIKHTKDFSVLEINLKTSTESFVINYEGSEVTDIFSVVLEAPYTKDMYVHLQGLSDYKYVYDYMPQWSTAFKNVYSNHTQAFEPLFTNSLNIDYNVDNLIKDRPIQNLKNILFYRKDPIVENISEKSLDYFIKEKEYVINSEDTIGFGTYNTIYIKLKTPGSYKLRIKGIYNSAYIKEDILIYGEGVFTLNLKYSHIYSINMIEFYSENIENSVLLSNVYEIKDFNFQNKADRSLEYSDNKVISTLDNDKNVFINKLPYYDGMFIDNQDNVIVDYNNKLYTAKLNTKLNLNIPKDVTYNNTKYLEGYITKGSGDKGIDFITRIDIGQDLSGIKMVVIGQAKCQNETINSKDIARTIAKLKRNYVGVFVTNSTFSQQTQEEILEDQYPLIMINGNKIAQLTNKYILDSSKDLNKLEEYLNNLDEQYNNYKSNIRPDDIIYK